MQAARFSQPVTGNVERLRRAVRSCVEPLERRALLSVTALTENNAPPVAEGGVPENNPPVVTGGGIQDVAVPDGTDSASVDLWPAFEDVEDVDRDLTYTVAANTRPGMFDSLTVDADTGKLLLDFAGASGQADVTVRATDRGTVDRPPASVTDTFRVTLGTNDAPSFTKGPDVTVLEDPGPQTFAHWATNISAGPPDEAWQTVQFLVTTDTPGLFAEGPAIAPEGTLTFTLAEGATGTATVTVRLKDSGGTAYGQDTSPPQTFTITVTPVEDPPTINRISNRVVEKNSPPTTVALTGVTPGRGEEATQTVTLTAVSENRDVVPDPVLAGTGSGRTLTFQPVADATGEATITLTATDSTGLSTVRSFVVRVVEDLRDPAADEKETRVNTHTDGVQQVGTGQSVAADKNGNFVVTWASFGQGDDPGYGVYAKFFHGNGVERSPEIRVNGTTLDLQQTPSVAMDENGNTVIVWQSASTGPEGWDVYGRIFGPDGTPRTGEFRINTHQPDHQTLPSVSMDRDGDFVVAWSSRGQDGSGEGVYAQRFNALGEPQGQEFRVSTRVPNDQSSPVVAAQPGGAFAVAWQSFQQDGNLWGIYAQQYNALGEPVGDEVRMNDVRGGNQVWPSIAASAGGYVVAWSAARQESSTEPGNIYFRRLEPGGPSPDGEQLVNANTDTGNQLRPSVAADANGNFVITWEGDSEAVPTIPWEFRAQRFAADGAAIGGEIKLNILNPPAPQPAPTSSYGVDAALDADGNLIAAWTSLDGSSFGVSARRFRFTDDPGPGPSVVVTASEFLYQAVPHRLMVRFNVDVSASLADGDLVVRNVATDGTVPVTLASYDEATNTAVFSFGGSVPNGNYRATLPAGSVNAAGGGGMIADHTLDFFSLLGDINRDRRVDSTDFAILAGNFGKTGVTFAQGDLNGSGNVDSSDFATLAGNFGKAVPAPPPPPAPLLVATTAPVTAAPVTSAAPVASPAPAARAATRRAVPKKAAAPKKTLAPTKAPPRRITAAARPRLTR